MRAAGFVLLFGALLAVGVESLDLLSHARRVYEQTKEMQEYPFELAADGLSLDRLLANGDVIDTIHGLTPLCRTDLRRVGNGIANLRKGVGNEFDQKAVVPLIDASGRIEPGVLRGRISFYGMVSECEAIDYEFADSGRHFGGQYARISLNAGFANYSHCARGYSLDVCVPLACTTNDILLTFRKLFETKQGDALESPVCSASRLVDERPTYNYQSYIVLGVMSGITLVCLLASIYDAFILPELGSTAPDSFGMSCFRAFSTYTIIRGIMSTSAAKKPGQIPQLNSMRFFSMCWVISGHALGTLPAFSDNPVDVFEVIGSFGGQLIANAYYSVDTFFFQSGLLLSFLWFRTYRKNPRVANAPSTWVLFYVHRILRLSPAYFIVLVFFTFVYSPYLFQFPVFMGLPSDALGACAKNYWWHFLYLNNYVHLKNACYVVSWYLATDMQMYVFAPLLIVPFTYSEVFGWVFALVLLAASTLANFITVIVLHFGPSNFNYGWQDPEAPKDPTLYARYIYNAPYIRCQVYIIGFLVGYFLQRTTKLRIPRVMAVMLPIRGWTLGHPMSLGGRAIFSALSRIGWGLMLSWIVIACYYGHGGPINVFLSWGGWFPLGRLTYSAYLIHLIVIIQLLVMQMEGTLFVNLLQTVCTFNVPVIAITYILAVFWSAIFEVPFAKLETIVTARLFGGISLRRASRVGGVQEPKLPTKL